MEPTTERRPISISAVVDVVGTLAGGGLDGNLHLLDTRGSTTARGEPLRTRVERGDRLHWTVIPLECEAYAAIDGILIDPDVCAVERRTYPGTDISYWAGTVLRDDATVPYHLRLRVGGGAEPFTTASALLLAGAGAGAEGETSSEPPKQRASDDDAPRENPGQLNSVQLNIVAVVDVRKANATGSLRDALYLTDNSAGSTGRGTAHLQTACKQGQVLNWIVYGIDMERRPDGTWPPMPAINNIVFLDAAEGDDDDVTEARVCSDLKICGMPDRMRSPSTPVYRYWAGTVASALEPGVYGYRLVVELEQEGRRERRYLDTVETPSIRVHAIGQEAPGALSP